MDENLFKRCLNLPPDIRYGFLIENGSGPYEFIRYCKERGKGSKYMVSKVLRRQGGLCALCNEQITHCGKPRIMSNDKVICVSCTFSINGLKTAKKRGVSLTELMEYVNDN